MKIRLKQEWDSAKKRWRKCKRMRKSEIKRTIVGKSESTTWKNRWPRRP